VQLASLGRNGFVLMGLSALLFSGMSALAKLASAALPPSEVVLFRGLMATALLLGWHFARGGRPAGLVGHHRGLLLLRGVSGALALLLYFFALSGMPVADASLLNNCAPLFVILLAAPFLGERLPRRQLVAVPVILAGVALVIRPSLEFLNWYGLAAFASAALAAVAYLCVRRITRQENPLVVVLWFNAVVVLLAAPLAAPGFVGPSGREWLILAGVALLSVLAQVLLTLAYRHDQAGRVSLVGYLGPVFGALWDLALWGVLPRAWTLLGAGLILVALVWLHEQGRRHPTPPA
jgi:drug/metabolite transporter (DMT)-like permease